MALNRFLNSDQVIGAGVLTRCFLASATLLYVLMGAPLVRGQGTLRSPRVEISVRVTDFDSEASIEQVRVELSPFPEGVAQLAFTDSSGRTEFSRVVPGSYIVRASKAGFSNAEVRVDVGRGETNREVSLQMQEVKAGRMSASAGVVSGRTLSIPTSALKEFQKGLALMNEKQDPKGSAERFRKAIALSRDYYEAYFMMGMAYLKLNSYDEAQEALAKSVSLNPKFLEPYYPLATLLIARKQYDGGERLLLRAMELDKNGWRWPFELARCSATQKKWDKALTYGRMAHDRPRAPSKVHLLMADLYSNTGNPGKAIEELQEFSRLDPQSPYMPRVEEVTKELRKRM